ncbi:MAG TPA: LacI family DNA-binding transcriptional regulator [Chryseosolibacter sp.]|nr:LacI family DNA-binding transcriptional regulator [Chryseosolibacter sp.]
MTSRKEPTIYDLAKRLNVSSSTISRALSNHDCVSKKTRKRVVELAEELGYTKNNFASQLRSGKTHTIGVITHNLNSAFITSILTGIEKVASESQYNIIIRHSSDSNEKEIANADILFRKRVDGLIVSLASDTTTISHYNQFVERGVPVVFFDRVQMDAPGVRVVIDNKTAGYKAAKHLIGQGCKRIMHVTGNLSKNVYVDRLQGLRNALAEHDLPFESTQLVVNDLNEQSGIAVAEQILNMEVKPDGLFIVGDLCASLCMQHLKTNGIGIPQDIAIVGFNNDVVSRIVEPKLTTINYSGREMGEVAATNLISKLNGGVPADLNYTIVLASGLIVRDSSLRHRMKL